MTGKLCIGTLIVEMFVLVGIRNKAYHGKKRNRRNPSPLRLDDVNKRKNSRSVGIRDGWGRTRVNSLQGSRSSKADKGEEICD